MTRRHPVRLVFPDGDTVDLDVSEDESVWDAALARGLELPATCLQGWCLTCAGRVVSGEWDQSQSLRYFPEDRRAGFILPCTGSPRSAMEIRTHQKAAMQTHRQACGLPTPRG